MGGDHLSWVQFFFFFGFGLPCEGPLEPPKGDILPYGAVSIDILWLKTALSAAASDLFSSGSTTGGGAGAGEEPTTPQAFRAFSYRLPWNGGILAACTRMFPLPFSRDIQCGGCSMNIRPS